jgi:hypothetical protein
MFTRTSYAEERGGERNDCSIRAFSVAACVSYDTALKLFARHGRRPNKGTPGWVTQAVLKDAFPQVQSFCPLLTLTQFVKKYPVGHYILHTRNHALAVIDGDVHDWKMRPKTKIWTAWRVDV